MVCAVYGSTSLRHANRAFLNYFFSPLQSTFVNLHTYTFESPNPTKLAINSMVKRTRGADTSNVPAKRKKTTQPVSRNMTTRNMSRIAAATAVFMTTELLENILWFLPMKDLLLNQRVCRKWQVVIEDTPRLQQSLFFRPR